MVDDSGRVRQIAWLDVFPWLRLLKCPRLSLSISLLVLAFLGWLGMTAGWRFFAYCWSGSDDAAFLAMLERFSLWPWENPVVTPADTLQNASLQLIGTAKSLSQPALFLFERGLSFGQFVFFLLCTIWTVLVWSIFGAAITRIAALALTREHKLGLRGGLLFGLLRWPSYVGCPALPLTACLLLAIPLLVIGWLSRLDSGALLVSLIWPLALLGGGLIALLAIGLMLGWPLMWPTISTEATDSFDGLSRAYSYTLHRPLRYLGYVVFAGLLGTLLLFVSQVMVTAILDMTLWGFSIGAGNARIDELYAATTNGEQGIMYRGANSIFGFWGHLLQLIPLAVATSYFWTAMTQVYLLLRRDEDGAELDEVFLPAQDKEFGLPPLKHDAAGVPGVADPLPPGTNSPDDTAMGAGS